MGVLDRVKEMKRDGLSEGDIFGKLQEEGHSPSEINDAFHQIKIKNAITAENTMEAPRPITKKQQGTEGQFYTPRTKDVEENYSGAEGDYYTPQNTEEESDYSSYQNLPTQQMQQQPSEGYYPQYQQYDEYQPGMASGMGGIGGATDTDTIIEIAEQVFSEKTKKIQKQIDSLNEFATLAQQKISNNNERLKRIEKIIDNLQIKILEKISDYGENISGIKKEMSMMEDSFSKVLPKLAEAHSAEHHRKK